ncbi:MAG TPA: hypothetical protein PLM07_15260 [Candidatus Rifleibacterium sp.]|nr:hypothetical protein [Candidatus Rifleibacterium sp.]HPT47238.1 hypothetical protein [Candidatus Rifleibacterium sp.]
MKKILLLVLLLGLVISGPPAIAEDDESPALENAVKVDVDDIKLRPALEIEQAVMEYMLAFEAYNSAKKSKDPAIRGKIVQLMKQYREAYARFLSMMHADKLYEPQKPQNPAGRYNKKLKKDKGNKRNWKPTAAKDLREKIKKLVESGASPKEIKEAIHASLPKSAMSADPCDPCNPCPPNQGDGGSIGQGNVGKDGGRDRDRDEDEDRDRAGFGNRPSPRNPGGK